MPQMSSHNAGEPWLYPVTLTTSSHNVVFNTENKFLDANIRAEISVQSGSISPIFSNTNLGTYFNEGTQSSNSISISPLATNTAGFIEVHDNNSPVIGTTAYYTIKTTSHTFLAEPDGDSTAEFTNITTSSTDNGIEIQTKYSINSATIKYAAAAPAGWVESKTINATTGSSTISKTSTDGTAYYITGINVPITKNFTLTTATNSNTDSSKVTITNNNNRNIEITTNDGTVTVRHPNSSKGNVYVRPYGENNDILIIDDGDMLIATITQSLWSVDGSTYIATMGSFNWTDGFIATSSLSAATFKNTATSGTTYVDLSNALVSAGGSNVIPEIIADENGDRFLYIDRGYIDNVKISLARLIPDADNSATPIAANYILLGNSAYDINGNLISGTIITKTASDLTFDTSTGIFTTPSGYYASNATYTIGIGTITPDYSFPGSGDNDLDNYLQELNSSTSADTSINKTYSNTVGYIAAHSDTSYETVYYSFKAPTFETVTDTTINKSELVADSTNTSSARSIYVTGNETFVNISSNAPALNTTGKVYIKVSSQDKIKTTSTGRGILKSGVTIATAGTHISYVGIDLYDGAYQYVSST